MYEKKKKKKKKKKNIPNLIMIKIRCNNKIFNNFNKFLACTAFIKLQMKAIYKAAFYVERNTYTR